MPESPDCSFCSAIRPCLDHTAGEDITNVDQLWCFVYGWLERRLQGSERHAGRRLLLRRLRHPEMGRGDSVGLALGEDEIKRHHWTRRGPAPKLPPSICECGATRRMHAEDGSYDPNGCTLFTPMP